jgi:hypothetical protein
LSGEEDAAAAAADLRGSAKEEEGWGRLQHEEGEQLEENRREDAIAVVFGVPCLFLSVRKWWISDGALSQRQEEEEEEEEVAPIPSNSIIY